MPNKIFTATAGIPNVRWFGTDGENYALVMDLLGDDLEELFDICGKKLSLKSVLMLADQMVRVASNAYGLAYLPTLTTPSAILILACPSD